MRCAPRLSDRMKSYNHFFGYMLINPSRQVAVSLESYSCSTLVRLGGFKSVENNYLNGNVTHRIKIRAQASTFFSLQIFLFFLYYVDIHMVHERGKCTPLRSYISRAVNEGAELNVYGNVS